MAVGDGGVCFRLTLICKQDMASHRRITDYAGFETTRQSISDEKFFCDAKLSRKAWVAVAVAAAVEQR